MKHATKVILTLTVACWIGATAMAALPTDLTASATLSSTGSLGAFADVEFLRDASFFGTEWITTSTTEALATYSWATPQYLSYAFLGRNLNRVPDGVTVQYSVNDDGNWVDAGTAVPAGGIGVNYVPIAVSAKAVRVSLTKDSAAFMDLDAFHIFGSATVPGFPTNMATDMMANATVQLTGLWENSSGLAPITHFSNTAVPDTGNGTGTPVSQLRANGDMPTKPEAILTWTTDQQVGGIALANVDWASNPGSGKVLEMHVDVLPTGMDPVLATEDDWFLVGSYSDTGTTNGLIHLPFESLLTRGLRLVITDVGDGIYGPSRAGGDISELIVIGGIIVPEPGTLVLLGLSGMGLLARRRRG